MLVVETDLPSKGNTFAIFRKVLAVLKVVATATDEIQKDTANLMDSQFWMHSIFQRWSALQEIGCDEVANLATQALETLTFREARNFNCPISPLLMSLYPGLLLVQATKEAAKAALDTFGVAILEKYGVSNNTSEMVSKMHCFLSKVNLESGC